MESPWFKEFRGLSTVLWIFDLNFDSPWHRGLTSEWHSIGGVKEFTCTGVQDSLPIHHGQWIQGLNLGGYHNQKQYVVAVTRSSNQGRERAVIFRTE